MKQNKIAIVAAGTAALLVAGLAVGYGAGTATASTTRRSGSSVQARGSAVSHATVLDGTTGSTLTPITSCRVVDTRSGGGALTSNAPRSFQIAGTTGFGSQGGPTNGCAIPVTATAVTGTLTMVGASNNGFIHLYPQGKADPGASFLNFTKSFNVSGSGLFKLGSTGAVTMNVLGASSNVVLDLTGYYVAPMDGLIGSDGSVSFGSRITATTHPATGDYTVTFDRDISTCTTIVTGLGVGYIVNADGYDDGDTPDTVYVNVREAGSAASEDEYFYIQVTC